MVFPIVGGTQDTGYEIDNSLRFNEDDSAYLSKTWGSEGSKRTMTFSFWFKRGEFGDERYNVYAAGADANNRDTIATMDESFDLILQRNDTTYYRLRTNRLFRDPSAWYHMVIAIDTTDGTASNRFKMYVNGVQETSFATSDYPTQNLDLYFNDDIAQYIGRFSTADSNHWDGHMADFYFIDGTQYAASDFGETNDNGVWIPKKFAGTFGSNGFKLEFKQTGTSANSSGIGADTSGNDNHFAVTNLAAIDVTVDTPTNNFATLVPALNIALSEGNTKVVTTRQSNWDGVHSSIGVTSGKWYFEVKASLSDDSFRIGAGVAGNPETFPKIFNGLGDNGDPLNTFSNTYPFYGKGVWLEHWYDQNYDDSSTASAQSSGDILQFALDMDNYKLWVGVNGQFKDNSNNNVSYSDVASGNSPTVTIASAAYTGKTFFPGILIRDDQDADDNVAEINFGNPSFSISSGNTDGLYGNFEYAVPSGYYALCTKRLATYG
jgi:hypothetical protein